MSSPGNAFALDVSKFVQKVQARADLVVRKIALDVFSKVIMRSPVDTGRFRGNWQVAIGEIPAGTVDVNDKEGTATIAKVTAEALKLKAGQVIFLVNNLPYAWPLENGHSSQAPSGMVGITVVEYQQIVDAAVREK